MPVAPHVLLVRPHDSGAWEVLSQDEPGGILFDDEHEATAIAIAWARDQPETWIHVRDREGALWVVHVQSA